MIFEEIEHPEIIERIINSFGFLQRNLGCWGKLPFETIIKYFRNWKEWVQCTPWPRHFLLYS